MASNPKLIALCGQPGSGKSTIQEILERRLNLKAFDDGYVIRHHCMELFGLSYDDVFTQNGKKRHTNIQGKSWENRKILGEYGAMLEHTFGRNTVPSWAVQAALRNWSVDQHNFQGYSFGSVRRGQGEVYRNKGGIVVEIVRPDIEHSENIWDNYDQQWVSHTFTNDAETITELEQDVVTFFSNLD